MFVFSSLGDTVFWDASFVLTGAFAIVLGCTGADGVGTVDDVFDFVVCGVVVLEA